MPLTDLKTVVRRDLGVRPSTVAAEDIDRPIGCNYGDIVVWEVFYGLGC